MIRRIVLVGMLLGLAAPSCYDVPRPACGFFCGTGGACPDDYTCNQLDNRCHLNGSPAQTCATHDAGPVDSPPDMMIVDGNQAPFVTDTTPATNETNVSLTTGINAGFSEDVVGVSNRTFTVTTGSTAISGSVSYFQQAQLAVFTPDDQLLPGTTYTVSLTSGITDHQLAPLVPHSWSFVTGADTIAPSVTQQGPAPGDTAVSTTSTVIAVFSEQVSGVSATTFTLAAGATPIGGTVTYSSANRAATFTPSSALPQGTVLTATLTAGIADLSGNALMSAPVTWTFTTVADTTPPTVTMRTPAAGATNVVATSNVTVKFSENVTGVSGTTFTLADGATPIAGTVTYDANTTTATFDPTGPMPYSTAITATLTGGITDLNANPLASAPVTWMFTTEADTVPPNLMSNTPMAGRTAVPTSTTISVTFDEPVTNVTTSTFLVDDGSAVAGTLASTQGGRTWTFTPSAALASAASVSVMLTTGITDTAGNALLVPVMFMFTTQ